MAGIRAFGVSDRLTAKSVDGLQVIYHSLASSQWRFLKREIRLEPNPELEPTGRAP
jgi:hypothetical protein